MRLRVLLALAFAALTAMAGLGVAILAQRDTSAALRADAKASLAEAARAIADGLDRGMLERWRDLALIASLDRMRDPDATVETRRALLQRLHESLPDYGLIGFVTPDGRIAATSNGMLEGTDASGRDYFLRGREHPMAGDVHEAVLLGQRLGRSPDNPPRFVDLARPVLAADGTLIGVIIAYLSWEWAEDVKRSVIEPLRAYRPRAEGFVLAADGSVLLGPTGSPGPARDAPPAPDGPQDDETWHWASEGGAGSRDIIGWALTRGDRDYPGLGWSVAVRQEASQVYARADRLRERILVWGATAAGLAALLGWLLADRLARPLEALAQRAMAAAGHRTGSGRLPPPFTREEAEIDGALSGLVSQRDATAAERDAVGGDLARRDAELLGLLRACPFGVVLADTGGRVRRANQAFLDLVGLDHTALALRPLRWDELTPPEWLPRDEAAIAEAVAVGRCTPYEKEFVRPDGTRVPVLVAFAMVDRATGQTAGYVLDLTEHRRAETERSRLAEQMRLAIRAAQMFFWDWDVASGRVDWSDGLEEACGLPPGSFGGTVEAFRALIEPEDVAGVEAALGAALADGRADYEAEFRMRRPDGTRRWVLARGTVLRDAEGRPTRIVGIDLDITGRKAMETALAERKALLRLFIERAPAAFAVFDTEMRYLATSRRFLTDYGLSGDAASPSALVGRSLYEVFPDIPPRWRDVHRRVLAGETLSAEIDSFPQPGGPTYWLRWEMSPWRRADGSVGGALLFADLLNERIEARRALEESEAWLRRATEVGQLGLFEVEDPGAGGAAKVSDGFRALYGLGPEAHCDLQVILDRVHPGDRAAFLADHARLAEEGGHFAADFRVVLPDGTIRWLHAQGEAEPGPDGMPRRLRGVNLDITKRRQAEDALAESETRLRLAMDASGAGMFDFDAATGLKLWDGRVREIWGVPLDFPVTYDVFAAGIHPEDLPAVEAAMARAYDPAGPGIYQAEYRVTSRTDGVTRHVAAAGRAIFKAGEAVRLVGTLRDVSERRAAEAALRQREAMLRLAMDAGEFGAWSFDPSSGRIEADARARALLGLGPADALGYARVVRELVHPDDGARVDAAIRAAVQPGGPGGCDIEHRVLRPDGSLRWLSLRGRVTAQGEGRGPYALFGTIADVTDRVELAARLADAAERLRLCVEAAELGVLEWDLRTGALTLSERGCALYGLEGAAPQDVDALLAALHAEDRDRLEDAIARALQDGTDFDVEHRVPGPGGGERWLRLRGRAEHGRDGGLLALRGAVMDIDAQKRAEVLLREDRDRLEVRVAERTRALSQAAAELRAEIGRREEMQTTLLQAQKLEALGQLTSGVAHDFNNLLAVVQGSFRLLSRRLEEQDQRARDLVRHGLAAAERGARLIAQMMAFARKEELRPRLVDPGHLLRGAEDLICQTAGGRVSCHFEVGTDLPRVIVDPVRLETVLLNLAANARDAMPDGGRLRLSAATVPAAELPPGLLPVRDHVLLSVSDSGVGMDEEILRRATEPFFTTKPVGKGTGLGLASAHGFAEQSGGLLRLRSTPGQGTTVEIFLPAAAVLTEAAVDDDGGAGKLDMHGNAKILLVDDDDGVRAVTAAILRGLGYQLIEAVSAEAAESLVVEEAIDMAVIDVVLPGSNGPALVARLHAERPDLPVLYITGYAGGAVLDDAPVLRKPFTDAELAQAVLEGLGRSKAARAAAPFVERVRHPALRDAYTHWLRRRGARVGLPMPVLAAGNDLPEDVAEHSFLVEVLDGERFRYVRTGRALQERAGRALIGEVVSGAAGASEDPALTAALGTSTAAAYGRCASGRGPQYEFARIALGDARPILFERLLLPLSARGDATVTHLLGVAVYSELPARPGSARQ